MNMIRFVPDVVCDHEIDVPDDTSVPTAPASKEIAALALKGKSKAKIPTMKIARHSDLKPSRKSNDP